MRGYGILEQVLCDQYCQFCVIQIFPWSKMCISWRIRFSIWLQFHFLEKSAKYEDLYYVYLVITFYHAIFALIFFCNIPSSLLLLSESLRNNVFVGQYQIEVLENVFVFFFFNVNLRSLVILSRCFFFSYILS